VVVHHDHVLGSPARLRYQERGVVHIRDADRLHPRLDGRAGESVIGEDQVGRNRLQHPLHHCRPVGVSRLSAIAQQGNAIPVIDGPVVVEMRFAPAVAVGSAKDRSPFGEPPVEGVVVQR
jgi:hypothetical protein